MRSTYTAKKKIRWENYYAVEKSMKIKNKITQNKKNDDENI